jgi:hypothetical protein
VIDPLSPTAASDPVSPALTGLITEANETLETAVNQATHAAFNLGCLMGLLPAVIFAVVTFLVTGFSLIGAAMAVVLGITGAVAFANLAAMITRRNTLRRTYHEHVRPDITRALAQSGHSQAEFEQAARQTLTPSAPLYLFINPLPAEPAETASQEEPRV